MRVLLARVAECRLQSALFTNGHWRALWPSPTLKRFSDRLPHTYVAHTTCVWCVSALLAKCLCVCVYDCMSIANGYFFSVHISCRLCKFTMACTIVYVCVCSTWNAYRPMHFIHIRFFFLTLLDSMESRIQAAEWYISLFLLHFQWAAVL